MEIYIHSHQIIMLQIINSDVINSSFKEEYGTPNLPDCLSEFIKEWDSFETAYQKRMTILKHHIHLWQQYLYRIHKLESSFKHIRKIMVEKILIVDSHELSQKISWIMVYII